jgi:hypothetical protein
MSDERTRQAFAVYRDARVQDQIRYYSGTSAEYDRANSQSVAVAAVLLSLTTLAGTLAGLDVGGKMAWAIVAAVLPAISTALAAYDALYGFERIGKLYADASRSLRQLEEPDPVSAAEVAAYAAAVETVFRNEQAQWGQLLAKSDAAKEGSS